MKDRLPRKLAAIMYADVVGYSRLTGEDEDATHRTLSRFLDLVSERIDEHHGQVIHYAGDAVLAKFDSVVGAMSAAVAVQRELSSENQDLADESQVLFRIGINLGDVIEDRGDIYGDGVNVAARLESLAKPGGICVSDAVRTAIGKKLDLHYEFLGEREAKNIAEPIRAYNVVMEKPTADVHNAPVLKPPDKPSIAVLPFVNMSADPDQDYFVDGITEDIITSLSKCKWMFVIARNSTFRYRGGEAEVGIVGKELGVRYVLEGSIRKSEKLVRITSQLIEVENGSHLWAERYDRSMTNIFELQDEITQNVVAALEPTLKKAEIERVKRKRPDDLDAYDLYLRALHQMYEVRSGGRVAALDYVAQALKIDPNYAEVHGVAAWCYFAQSLWEGNLPDSYRGAMLRHARAVQELKTEDASTLAHAAIGLALATHDYEAALAMIERAISINPNSAHAYGHGSVINTWAGNYDKAIELSNLALRLSPFDPLSVMPLAGQAGARMMKGDYEGAVTYAKRALQIYPTHSPSFLIKIACLIRLEKKSEAQQTARQMLEVSPSYKIVEHAPVLEHFLDELREAGLPG